ncbi:stage II sporulation protein R [Cohnella candidum]|uniref:Stage II sporulation protein R n=1 Tax=Cohnella candidum TaxID=2674991 RepID=A0A3G3K2F3_9BACL|nr:stage II sporulation protein R [Cohnella candidum]AYQ74237.1 stage II sporulation protein R [Cohnella candidum]
MRRQGHHFTFIRTKFAAIFPNLNFQAAAKAVLVCLILVPLLSSTMGAAAQASSSEDEETAIPPDAIRIRILANSDSDFDQKVKRDVRDRVEALILSWGPMPGTHEQARALIASHLNEIQQTADQTLQEWGVDYGAATELAKVPFPEKTFEGRSYPSGNYEALRISLGGAQGANWWCVLFPPLCLTAATKSEEAATAKPAEAQATVGKASTKTPVKTSVRLASAQANANDDAAGKAADADSDADKPKPRFFLWELLQKFGEFLGSIFS